MSTAETIDAMTIHQRENLSSACQVTMSAMAIWLWYQGTISTGAIAFAVGLTLRLKAMSQWIIWEVAGLFENIGVIQDGIETIAREIAERHGATVSVVTGDALLDENYPSIHAVGRAADETDRHEVSVVTATEGNLPASSPTVRRLCAAVSVGATR